MVGTNGLEPSTSRLSGVRSNHLSYAPVSWWRWGESNSWPPACKAGALPAELHPRCSLGTFKTEHYFFNYFLLLTVSKNCTSVHFSLERRWSSRTFRYGYLVTTSPQSSIPPSTAPSLRLGYWLRVLPTPMVWRAVCTRPGNVFTATFWFAITSNSDFMQASCSLQSELGQFLEFRSTSLSCFSLLIAIVVRV